MANAFHPLTAGGAVFSPASGFWESNVPSQYEGGPGRVRVLVPDNFDQHKKYPVLYILPVAGYDGASFGSGIAEAKKADVANKYGVICVYPSFAAVPWYGNHATDPKIRQEDCILRTLLPYVESNYPVRGDKEGRWLIGFSKSGWGAFTLFVRHPNVFGYSAAWDVPFMIDGDHSGQDWGPMGISVVMGTKENSSKIFCPPSWRRRIVPGSRRISAGSCSGRASTGPLKWNRCTAS